ncbi:MAG: transpeptidase family protein [Deltaproteobacteria bacterium]|jgi:cell division protein FtsI (penicillin-binding protein 3)|nr:transpeptidase family protein [Deltaproteobacteria bacterium]
MIPCREARIFTRRELPGPPWPPVGQIRPLQPRYRQMHQRLSDIMRSRNRILAALFVCVFAAVLARAGKLQILDRDELRERSRETTQRTLTLNSLRGDILDCRLEKLATSVASGTLSVHGAIMKEPGEIFLRLSEILHMDYEELARKLEGANRYAVVKRHLDGEESEAAEALRIEGVTVEKGYKRVYPNGSLAAHLLGFVGVDGNGLEGLELALNDSLVAPARQIKVTSDKRGRLIMNSAEEAQEAPRGGSVILTLDRRIQQIAERSIADAVERSNAKSGMVIAVRPYTGEIVASAVYPTFDPNNYGGAELEARRNMILTDPYEPGSTFKIFTVAAGLEEGIISPETVFYCENGYYKVDGDNAIRDTGNYGDLTVSQIVQKSSNIGASKVGERLGPRRLHNYLTRFSFGEKSGLAYPSGESAGKIRPAKDWKVLDASNISFGQGLSVTGLQLAMAVAALGNDGALMRPMLVSRVIDGEGRVIEQREPEIIRQVVSPLVARQVTAMMRMVVLKGGTGRKGEVKGYPVAAKTGTSQVWDMNSKSYRHDRFIASFVGLAPYENPELCLLVVLVEPWPSYYGGTVAAPVFKEIMEKALPLLDVPPTDGESPPRWPKAQRPFRGAPGVLSDYSAANYVRMPIPKGDRGAAGPIEPAGEPEAGPGDGAGAGPPPMAVPGVMPDVSGLSMRAALDLLAPSELALEFHGSGLAVGQDPSPGSRTSPGQLARVSFAGR